MGRLVLAGFLIAAYAVAEAPDPALLKIKRVFVDPLVGGDDSSHMRDLLITALQNSKLFIVTESLDRADAYVRGAATYDTYDDKFDSTDSLNARSSVSGGASSTSYTRRGGASSRGPSLDMSAGENDHIHMEERKHDAMMTIRLVNKDGDVIWSTTKESAGAKFRGAAADVADKIAKQLIADFEKVKKEIPATSK